MKKLFSRFPHWQELWKREKFMARNVMDFCRRFFLKMEADDVLFLASGLAFNVLLCLVPILLTFVYVLGLLSRSVETTTYIDRILAAAFPSQPHAIEIRRSISALLNEVVINSKSLGILSLILLLAASASLFSSTRSVLHRVFEVKTRRHFVISYLVDLSLVLGLTLLVLVTMSFNWLYKGLKYIQDFLPSDVLDLHGILGTIPDFLSLGIIILLCYLLYRLVPVQRTRRRTAFIAACTTALIWEVSGRLFAFYLTTIPSFNKIYGAYAFMIVMVVWTFYSCVIFVLGAEVGHVLEQNKNNTKAASLAKDTV